MSVQVYWRTIFRSFELPPNIPVDEWSERYRQMNKRSNRRGGGWKTRCTQREPLREMTNPEVRSICIVGASQTFGKSELILNYVGRQIHLNPGPMMIVQPTNDFAKRFSRKRLDPMLEDCDPTRKLVAPRKSRSGANTLNAKEFPGGEVRTVGAETPGNLASDPTRDVLFDEVDRCQKSCGREGDVISLGEARQEDFGKDAFSLYVSSPSGVKPKPGPLAEDETQPEHVSRIMLLFAETDQRYWYCPCQKCGRHQTLKWSQVVWPEHRPQEARYICEFGDCLHPHNDAERVSMVEQGEWRATAPFTGKRGYFLNAIASLSQPQRSYTSKLHQLAATFLSAKRRGAEALKTWFNTQMCECFSEDTAETMAPLPLYNRREIFGDKLNPLACIITAGVDVHPDRIELQIVAWGAGEEAWSLDYEVFMGNTKQQAVWSNLDAFIKKAEYEHPCGVSLKIERYCVDTGHSTDEAYNFCKDRVLSGAIAIKGMTHNSGRGKPVMNPPRNSGVRKVRLWLVSKHTALRTILAALKSNDPGPGYIHFRSDLDPKFGVHYFRQLTANEIRIVKKAGTEYEEFDPGSRADEAMDTFIYALAALRQRTVQFEKILARLKTSGEAEKEIEARPANTPLTPIFPTSMPKPGWRGGGFRR